MVLAYHFILSAYGFWLPNDPRGSWSAFVGAWDLLRSGGTATKVSTTQSVAHMPHDRAQRFHTKSKLKRPPVSFTGAQARAIATGFTQAAAQGNYVIYACCILPEHAHLVIGRHERDVGMISAHLKAAATRKLRADGLWVDLVESPWARKYWAVFISEERWLLNAIRYVNANPLKENKREQRWSFVRPYPDVA